MCKNVTFTFLWTVKLIYSYIDITIQFVCGCVCVRMFVSLLSAFSCVCAHSLVTVQMFHLRNLVCLAALEIVCCYSDFDCQLRLYSASACESLWMKASAWQMTTKHFV